MDLNINKYEYLTHKSFLPKILGVFGIISAISSFIGFTFFLGLDPIYIIIWLIPFLVIIFNRLMRSIVYLRYSKLDIKRHEKFVNLFWENNKQPSVDIFLPIADEHFSLLKKTIDSSIKVNYKNKKIYILDDGKNEKNSTRIKNYCEELGLVYLSRKNKQENKKAGNLRFGYENSKGEYVLVLDADFIPNDEILSETIPYIHSNNKIGILQTPQFFET